MFRTIIFTILVISTSIHAVSSLILHCNFVFDGWDFAVSNAYICKATAVNFTSKVEITNVEGQHVQSHTNNHVNALLIRNQICHYFPSGIEKYLPKLKGIAVQNSHLKVIRKTDIEPFKELKSLSLFGNDLTTIDFGLLSHNDKLQIFSAFSNKITAVADDFLDYFGDLKEVHLQGNTCTEMTAKTPEKLEVMRKTLKQKCPATEDMKLLRELEVKMAVMEKNLKELDVCEAVEQNQVQTDDFCDSNYQKMKEIALKFDIECEDFYESTCSSPNCVIQHDNMEVRFIKLENGSDIVADTINELEIQGRAVNFLPINLGIFLINLKNLTIISTKITKVEAKSMKNFGNLKFLSLSSNYIQTIQNNAFDELKICENLDLSSNKIVEISGLFSSMYNLRDLNLEENLIAVLNWNDFDNLGNLEVLNVRSNKLIQIGSNLNIANLAVLDLTENICVDLKYPEQSLEIMLDNFADNCTVEVELRCDFNVVNEDYICSAVNLNINSKNTKISRVTGQHVAPKKSLKDVTMFSSINQNVQFLSENLQLFLPNLSKVQIISSNLKELMELKNLKWMEITGNNLMEIKNYEFLDPEGIKYIDMSANKITKIPENFFSKLVNLQVLKLNKNLLTIIGKEFLPQNNSIKEFYGSDNEFKRIENEFVKNLRNADVIELKGNPCVDNEFKRVVDSFKKFNELYGEVVLHC